jgi:hypothetical protein
MTELVGVCKVLTICQNSREGFGVVLMAILIDEPNLDLRIAEIEYCETEEQIA